MKRRKGLLISLTLVIGLLALYVVVGLYRGRKGAEIDPRYMYGNALDRTLANYGEDVRAIAEDHDISYEYLMALIVLETSGKVPAGKRYEPNVFRRLKQVQTGDRKRYEKVKKRHLENASDEAIRNLATSWGPFQLMGYKCIGLNITVNDIRGDKAVKYGVEWIVEEYGHLLKKGKYKDAFHYHNTGRVYPKVGKPRTHDPNYVSKGLTYMEFFREH